jgi:myo-inositol-1(or 4)-monophosphatase
MSLANWKELVDAACEAARHGAAVLEEWRTRFQVREKGRFDLVTEADENSQRVIRDFLLGRFPEHAFIGEEDPNPRASLGPDAPPCWLVDPLDGTTNYVHGVPMYCVSIGLQVAGELVVGVIFDPSRNDLFWAAQGQGAWLNDQRLRTSTTDTLETALLATGFPSDVKRQARPLYWWNYFSQHTQSLRRTGSTALNLAYLAAGRYDGYYAFDNKAWDVAAGVVLIREAGGIITNVDGTPFDPFTPDGLASNGPLHPVLLETLNRGEDKT